MQYMGGKEQIAKHIVELIDFYRDVTGATHYLEPFVGGASIASRASKLFDHAILADAEPLVVDMRNASRAGWVPYPITVEQYTALRDLIDAGPQCGYAAFGVSFGGKKWCSFAKEYPGHYSQAGQIKGIAKKAAGLAVDLTCTDYVTHSPSARWLVYCDPPYAGTTGYGNPWDVTLFWETMNSWVEAGVVVLVSEYAAPPPWKCIWEKRKQVAFSSNKSSFSLERVFTR